MNRAMLGVPSVSKCGAYRARPIRFAATMSWVALCTTAGTVMWSSTRCTDVRTACGAGRRVRTAPPAGAVRARSNRYSRSGSLSRSARAIASSTPSDAPRMFPRSSRV